MSRLACGTRLSVRLLEARWSARCPDPAAQRALVQPRGCARSPVPILLAGDAEGPLAHADVICVRSAREPHAALVAAAVHLRLDANARSAAHVMPAPMPAGP